MFVIHDTLPTKKDLKKKNCLTTKSPLLSYCSGFIFNEKITMYIVLIAQKMKKKN